MSFFQFFFLSVSLLGVYVRCLVCTRIIMQPRAMKRAASLCYVWCRLLRLNLSCYLCSRSDLRALHNDRYRTLTKYMTNKDLD